MIISTRLGMAIAAGVPVLVLVSMGPVAGLAGPVSVLVWGVSALIGLVMALAFAELAGSFPHQTGGIGVLSARVWAPRSRALALVSQWSYWFGWSPALAINGILVGTYLRDAFMPDAPTWTAVLFATAILAASVTVNHFGMRSAAWLQVVLAVAAVGAILVVTGGALLRGRVDMGNLAPFRPPGGWASGTGLAAVAGGLFVAGWSAYGSELALAYGTEYRRGIGDAVRALVSVAAVSIVAYTVLPLVLIGVLGTGRIQDDPALALTPLVRQTTGGAADVVVAMLVIALLLSLNMVTISSSRTLYQMSRNGDAWTFLGQLNRHGVPGNALRFDLGVNVALLLAVLAVNRGQTAAMPIALLAAANVGYFISVSLALLAAWSNHRRPVAHHHLFRVRSGLMWLCFGLAGLNLALLAMAGFAWGWSNIAVGAAALTLAVVTLTRGRGRNTAGVGLRPRVTCMAWGACRRTASVAELRALHSDREAQRNDRRSGRRLVGARREPGDGASHRT